MSPKLVIQARIIQLRSQGKVAAPNTWIGTTSITKKNGKRFLGSVYQEGLLDQSEKETLVASLTQFDCVLFVETVLALVRGIAVEDYTYSTFTQNLVEQRYRQGKMETYCRSNHHSPRLATIS